MEGHVKPSSNPKPELGREIKMLGASQEWEAGSCPWSHPVQIAQTLTMMMHNDGGGDGDDSATFHLFGAAFLNPGCILESPQVFY